MLVRRGIIAAAVLAAGLNWGSASALAAFPYPSPSGNPTDFSQYRVGNQTPDDLTGNVQWMYSATPSSSGDPLTVLNNASPFELGGVRGAHVVDAADGADTAWKTTTGRPDVTIAVLDSGIEWNNRGAMDNVRHKVRINRGEAPVPRHDRAAPLEPLPGGKACSGLASAYDANGDGVFNVSDYACDSRVSLSPPHGVGPPGVLDPQDVLIAFSDGKDDDGNGFTDDLVGWDFLDNDNDPYDDVQYGHGTGESQDSTAEADNGGSLGTCPNCMVVPLRVGDSFVADVNRFAQAAIYAVDNGVLVIQEALGTLNNSHLARQAVDYAYRHGVTVIASAADEAAQHNNWPSSNPHVIVVNSVTDYDSTLTPTSRSYLMFNGCTNFNARVTVAIPSVSCSSDATGRGSGMAGLIYSAALNARQAGRISDHPNCRRPNGSTCVITANEVRQLMASGRVDGHTEPDDVDFAADPEPSCATRSPTCTDPFLGAPPGRLIVSPLATTRSYPARGGHDQFYGYGRVNVFRTIRDADRGALPPEVEITSPEWYAQVDPRKGSVDVRGTVFARNGSYTCEVLVAPGAYPNERSTSDVPPGDFKKVASPACDGSTSHTDELNGVLATLDLADLRSRFPPTTGNFDGREPGTGAQTAGGRPNTEPYGFVVKVVARTARGGHALEGQDRRQLHLHHDKDLLPDFPRELGTDGASSPLLVDLNGDNRNDLVVATSDGFVHAFERDGKELPGWPVRGDALALHTAGHAFQSGEVSSDFGGAFVAGLSAADLDRDGAPEVVGADNEGRVYAWNGQGKRVFHQEAEPKFSGKPLQPFVNVRQGVSNRTQHGFLASPVLADLDHNDGGRLEVVAAGMDRHVYAWNDDGSKVPGFPVLVVDRGKIQSIDPTTHAVTFDPGKVPDPKNQGGIVDTPAVANVDGAGDTRPEIVVGTNEEYLISKGSEGGFNGGLLNSAAASALAQTGQLDLANGRVYAIQGDGAAHPGGNPFVSGWPVRVGLLFAELLPVVGEGIDGSPVVAPFTCLSGGDGPKIGVMPAAGPAYIFNANGSSCYGKQGSADTSLQSDVSASATLDVARIGAVGLPAFGKVGGTLTFLAPVAGAIRALDLAAPEYQGGVDAVGAWNPQTGQYLPNWPAQVNDLQFLTGPAVADVDGLPGEEVVAGSASMDLAAFNAAGAPASLSWPKLTGDWIAATPLIGSLGTQDTDSGAHKVVAAITRRGTLFAYDTKAPACSPGSSPRFHHDNASSGDFNRDAVSPGRPFGQSVVGAKLTFRAPGDDLLCGKASRYELVASNAPITGASFGGATPVGGAPSPADAGTQQAITLPAGGRYVGLRAVDDQGNVGRPLVIDRGHGGGGPSSAAARRPCLKRHLGVTSRRIGPVRIGRRLSGLVGRYRVLRRTRRATRFCVSGGGRFLVATRHGKVDFIATTARGHGARTFRLGLSFHGGRALARGLRVGRRRRASGRVVYGIGHGKMKFVAVVSSGQISQPRALRRRFVRLGMLRR